MLGLENRPENKIFANKLFRDYMAMSGYSLAFKTIRKYLNQMADALAVARN
ncbi:hypothetical protein PPTG_24631 [Phytophthora nicotianae INRA-310]|uniref:Uncharacterized protein n=2 Tax=Phytophthora nicotianae TaxID=4792 RepID=W2PBH4_PHYN3|nr:hypothetical protein PPTG_24631 [Phytophthora nicotianae INRA-310]ETM98392.1 hypothetical protein PPTG_24631 [Phytophthora nicotianae INRA-310]